MKLGLLLNDPRAVAATQTTAMLGLAAARRGWTVWGIGVESLSMDPDDRLLARGRRAPPADDASAWVTTLAGAEDEELDLADLDAVLIRTNPARDDSHPASHDLALRLLTTHVARGGVVLNDPVGLGRASSKLYQAGLPARHRPRTLVSRDVGRLRAFVQAQDGRCVLKPLQGTRGQDVFFIDSRRPDNLSQILDVLVRDGVAMAQSFVPGAEQGDVRVVMLDGQPLTVDGHVAAIQRRPGAGELRSNIHQGGVAEHPVDIERALAVARAAGPGLKADGIWLAGLDVIGDQCVEINVFATGGLRDANRFSDVDFTQPILDALRRRVAAR